MSFRTKLLVVLVAFALTMIGAALVGVRRATVAAVRAEAESDFARTHDILDPQWKAQITSLEDALVTALGDPLFRSQLSRASPTAGATGLEDDDAPTPLQEVHGIFASADLPLFRRYPSFAVLNAAGVLIFSKTDTSRYGDALEAYPLIERVMRDGRAVTLIQGGTRLLPDDARTYVVVARAIQSSGGVLGYAVVAEALEGFSEELARSSRATVELVAQDDETPVRTSNENGETFLTLAARLADTDGTKLGVAKFRRSLDADVAPLIRRLDIALLGALVFALLAGLPIATVFARQLTNPLRSLEQAAKRIQGGDFSAYADVVREDEIGRVGRAFNSMTVALRERYVDPVTGAFNRRYLIDALEAQVSRCEALGARMSLVLLDIDHFRVINVKHNHEIGDGVLKAVATIATKLSRTDDVVARYADDAFIILMPDTDVVTAEGKAAVLRDAIAAAELQGGVRVTATMSVVEWDAARWPEAHDLLLAADRTLYSAKSGARNRVVKAA